MPSTHSAPRRYRRFRIPRADGTALVEPELLSSGSLLQENRAHQAEDFTIGDASRQSLMQQARREIAGLARTYTTAYRDVSLPELSGETFLLMSGHQPTLFHPGVWFKNCTLAGLAQRHQAIGIHLLVDNDVTAGPAIRVPQRAAETAHRVVVPLDSAGLQTPFEQWEIRNRDRFRAAGREIEQLIAPITPHPIIRDLWPDALQAAERTANLGQAVSQARHRLESRWQLQTLELPVSHMADTDSFATFCGHLLAHADAFRQIHNDEVLRYRVAHRIRSQAHPVPLLREEDDWVEVPFWSWSTAAPTRQPVYVRRQRSMQLRAGARGTVFSGPGNEQEMTAWLRDLRQQHIKIRPRALTNTMFARLLVCDLFLHGVGGAKYDELGDEICRQFFGVEPPRFMTLSATMLLPGCRPQTDIDDLRQLDGHLRDLWFHPDRHVVDRRDSSPSDRQLTEQKQTLVVSRPPAGGRREWHQQLEAVNAQLRQSVAPTRSLLQQERARLMNQHQIDAVMGARDHSFALFAENRLKPVLLDLSGASL